MTTAAGDEDASPLGLLTDLYELRMAQTCLRHGMTASATFSCYIRPTPTRPWFVAAGTTAALDVLDRFRYGSAELDYLANLGLSDDLLSWLEGFRPTGEMWAVPDGTVLLADEPLLEMHAPLPVGMLLETALINAAQYPTLIATKAARCAAAADGRPVADFGLRRAHGLLSGVEAARAAYVGGAASTSNVEAGRRFGIPVVGTMAHSFVQAFDDEVAAFRAFAEDHPGNAILLVDTYDSIQGIRHAIEVADDLRRRGESLSGIRLDSGDLSRLSAEGRRMLDAAGHHDARIFVSGGVDEHVIHELLTGGAPVDAFGVGTSLVVSRDQPALDIVYKLVEYDGRPRAKYSAGKELLPGAKQVFRGASPESDVLGRRDEDDAAGPPGRGLLVPVWRDGERQCRFDLETSRGRALAEVAALPETWRHPAGPPETPRPVVSEGLTRLAEDLRGEVTASR